MTRFYVNNFSTTLNGAITNVATSITLTSATGLPAIGAGEVYQLTITDGTNTEVVEVTDDASTPTLTVTRDADGNGSFAFADLDTVEIRANAESFEDVLAADTTPQLRGPLDFSGTGVYASFGGSSSTTAYNLTHSGGVPVLKGAANFNYTFTSSSLYMQAGTSFNSINFANDSTRLVITTNNSERMQVDDTGVNISNGTLIMNDGDIKVAADNKGLTLGAGGDATIQYDGTDLLIDPQAVGSGNLRLNNGSLVTTNGSSTAPSIKFGTATNENGFYGVTSIIIGASIAATRVFEFRRISTSGGQFQGVQYSTGATADSFPFYSFYGDNDSGLYRNNADEIGLCTGSVSALFVDSSQNVAIGNKAPGAKLDVTGSCLISGSIAVGDESELTISTGAITVTGGFHIVDTEADAASDDLDTINGGVTGQQLIITAANDARTVVVKDGTGNLNLAGDMSLDNTQDTITLIYSGAASAWKEISRSDNGA